VEIRLVSISRFAIVLIAPLLTPALNAHAQQAAAVRFDAGVAIPIHVASGPDYTTPSRRAVADLAVAGGVVATPVRGSALRILADIEWQPRAATYRLSDAAGRDIYTDYSLRDLTLGQLVGVQLGAAAARRGPVVQRRPGPLLAIGIGQVFRRLREEFVDRRDGTLPPQTSVRTGSAVHLAFVSGLDVPLGVSTRSPVFRLRARYAFRGDSGVNGPGWTVTPGVLLQFD
jgi:hypothetical protein